MKWLVESSFISLSDILIDISSRSSTLDCSQVKPNRYSWPIKLGNIFCRIMTTISVNPGITRIFHLFVVGFLQFVFCRKSSIKCVFELATYRLDSDQLRRKSIHTFSFETMKQSISKTHQNLAIGMHNHGYMLKYTPLKRSDQNSYSTDSF